MGTIIDGKLLAKNIREKITEESVKLSAEYGRKPCLAVILVGENPASQVYVRNKKLACAECGFESLGYDLPEDTTEEDLLKLIDSLNENPNVDGILVQLPLPKTIDAAKILVRIDPDKDVDGFHPINVGRMWAGIDCFLPCTPHGIIELIKFAGVDISGKNCVVCGRSNIVGKPVASLLMRENGTVTIAHTKTKNEKEIISKADIVVVAIGKAKYYGPDYFKEGAVVIDVGMNRDENGKLCGDVDFAAVFDKVGPITPVPGGVGPMTITMLMSNTLESFKKRNS